MINMHHQSGYYDMDNNVVIGDSANSNEVDVLTTPFSVRDILNIANQNSAEIDNSGIGYTQDVAGDLFCQKVYGNAGGNNCSSYGSAQYKRLILSDI